MAIAIACLAFAGCGTIGSGDIVDEPRTVDPFDGIDVSDGVVVHLTIDPEAEVEVIVTYDDNLLDHIETTVNGSTLRISSSGTVTLGGSGRHVSVVAPSIDTLTASGGADVQGIGELDQLTLDASGGADVNLAELPVARLEIDSSGGASVAVRVLESIVGDVSGGADVTVLGDPSEFDVDTSGGADLNRSD